MNLKEIRQQLADTKTKLANLKITKSLDDIASIRKERIELKEDIEILVEAEADEVARVYKANVATKNEQRKALLLDIVSKSNVAREAHTAATGKVKKLITELVTLIAEREEIFVPSDTNTNAPEMFDLLNAEERRELNDKREISVVGITDGSFSVEWRDTVNKVCAKNNHSERLRDQLKQLTRPHYGSIIYIWNTFIIFI